MKKTVYYISPFVFTTIIFLIATWLESMERLEPIMPFVIWVPLFLFSAAIGALSQAKAKFDYIVTIIVPLSVFFSLLIFLFFDEGCDGLPQMSLSHALNIEYYRSWLSTALVMMVITMVFSFKPIRDFLKVKKSLK